MEPPFSEDLLAPPSTATLPARPASLCPDSTTTSPVADVESPLESVSLPEATPSPTPSFDEIRTLPVVDDFEVAPPLSRAMLPPRIPPSPAAINTDPPC